MREKRLAAPLSLGEERRLLECFSRLTTAFPADRATGFGTDTYAAHQRGPAGRQNHANYALHNVLCII